MPSNDEIEGNAFDTSREYSEEELALLQSLSALSNQQEAIDKILFQDENKYVPLLNMTREMLEESAQWAPQDSEEEQDEADELKIIGGLILSLFIEFRVMLQAYKNLKEQYDALSDTAMERGEYN